MSGPTSAAQARARAKVRMAVKKAEAEVRRLSFGELTQAIDETSRRLDTYESREPDLEPATGAVEVEDEEQRAAPSRRRWLPSRCSIGPGWNSSPGNYTVRPPSYAPPKGG